MPKPKPDQVIRYEVVLGSTERQIIKDMRSAYVFNRISAPMVDLAEDILTSPRALATFLTFVGMFMDVPMAQRLTSSISGHRQVGIYDRFLGKLEFSNPLEQVKRLIVQLQKRSATAARWR